MSLEETGYADGLHGHLLQQFTSRGRYIYLLATDPATALCGAGAYGFTGTGCPDGYQARHICLWLLLLGAKFLYVKPGLFFDLLGLFRSEHSGIYSLLKCELVAPFAAIAIKRDGFHQVGFLEI